MGRAGQAAALQPTAYCGASGYVSFNARRGYRQPGWLLAGLSALLVAAPVFAQTPEPKWDPHIDLEARPGTDRSLGEADLFIPVAQSADTLLFASLRMRMDDNDGNEGNYGLGVRHMLESGWNLGAYGYFDRRRTPHDNHFNQVTLGFEALSQDWDLRGNVYLPQGRRSHTLLSVGGESTAELVGTSVQVTTSAGSLTEERSMGGFDAEIGWRVPIFGAAADKQFRIFGGAYHFSGSGLEDVTGPRLRAELVFDSVPYLWQGSRFTLGAEWQDDELRGSQGFLTARLRIPLQVYGRPASTLTPLERRMADPVVRDIDVVSQSRKMQTSPAIVETATQLADGASFTVVNSTSTAGDDLDAAVTAAGNNSTVILAGSFQTTGGNTVSLAFNQTLTGIATVRSASGRLATLNTGASIHGTSLTTPVVDLNAGGKLIGLTVTAAYSGANGGAAVRVAGGSTNVVIENNTITTTQGGTNAGFGLAIGENSVTTIRNNTITATGTGGGAVIRAVVANSINTTLTFAGNTVSASGGTTTNDTLFLGSGVTITSGSTGNIRGNGNCSATPASGSIGFTDGTTCP